MIHIETFSLFIDRSYPLHLPRYIPERMDQYLWGGELIPTEVSFLYF